MAFLTDFSGILFSTCRDVLPIIVLITGFQLLVLRQPIPHLRRLVEQQDVEQVRTRWEVI